MDKFNHIHTWWKEFFEGYAPEYLKYISSNGHIPFQPNVEIVGLKYLSLHYIQSWVEQNIKTGYKGIQTAHEIRMKISEFNATVQSITSYLKSLLMITSKDIPIDYDNLNTLYDEVFGRLEVSPDFAEYQVIIPIQFASNDETLTFSPVGYLNKGVKKMGNTINWVFEHLNKYADNYRESLSNYERSHPK